MATIVVVAVIVVIVVIGFVVVVAIAVVIVAVVAVVLIKNDWQQKLIRDQFSLDRIHLILSYNKIEHPIKRKRMFCLTCFKTYLSNNAFRGHFAKKNVAFTK